MMNADEQPLELDVDQSAKYAIDIAADFACEAASTELDIEAPKTEIVTQPFSLTGIKLEIPHGALVCVIGRVGVGKTSLLSAMINSLQKTSGHVRFGADVCYVPQQAWIQSGSVRQNITFLNNSGDLPGVLEACALLPDLAQLPDGVDTRIGERGITLSGGQKQRISIARAAYDTAQIVLLDDPLSALDPVVSQHLLHRCILGGPLSHRTRVLVTHQLDVLPHADLILVMDRQGDEGRIVQQGSYAQLIGEEGLFRELIEDYGSAASHSAPDTINADPRHRDDQVKGVKLTLDEDREIGETGWPVYQAWFKAVRSWPLLVVIALALAAGQVAAVGVSLWLVAWSKGSFAALSQGQYMAVYGCIGFLIMIFGFTALYGLAVAGIRASQFMYEAAWKGLMRTSAGWHDRTPSGRIISRMTKDVSQLDDRLTPTWNDFITVALGVLGTFGLIAYTYPWLCLAFMPLIAYVYIITSFIRRSSREVKRVESLLRSNVYSSFAEQLDGVDVIKAFGRREKFEQALQVAVDRQHDAHLTSIMITFWVVMRLGTVSKLLLYLVMLFGIANRKSVDPAKFGLTLVYTLVTTQLMQTLAILWAKCEQEMTHVERIDYFGKLKPEADLVRPTDLLEWPTRGEITFRNVQLRYRPDLPNVLNDLSFSVKAGEKVGIIGRTGAGKSSIFQALYRMVELTGGVIDIDGVDISSLGLHTLRSRMSVIPQDAFLFEGTVRSNIHPSGLLPDSALNDALNLIHSSNAASNSLREKFRLDAQVHAGGGNFSAGEKQLLALMRALVRRSKILVLDEATSSVDSETDALIQRIIQTEFADVTILCIAHRLQTVAHYDRVIVLDAGAIVEFDDPLILFDQPRSKLRSLCHVKGIRREDLMRARGGMPEQ